MLGDYVTLSYRWGVNKNLTTTLATLDDRVKGIHMRLLPAAMRDAVVATTKLGFWYLWIDALCIIQDSIDDWLEQSRLMASIYGNATLNIVADGASDCADGFLKRCNLLEIRSCLHGTLVAGRASSAKVICPALPRTGES